MFHKIKNVTALPDYKISIQFSEGVTKIYNVEELIRKNPMFKNLKNKELFLVPVKEISNILEIGALYDKNYLSCVGKKFIEML